MDEEGASLSSVAANSLSPRYISNRLVHLPLLGQFYVANCVSSYNTERDHSHIVTPHMQMWPTHMMLSSRFFLFYSVKHEARCSECKAFPIVGIR